MEEEKNIEAFSQLSEKAIESIENVLDVENQEDINGLGFFATLFALDDNDFEILRPLMQDSVLEALSEPQVQMAMVQSLGQSGITLDDILNHTDEVFEQLFNNDEINLSESKKDFFKFIFTNIFNNISVSTLNPAHIVEIPVELCRENAKLPTYATNGSGAMDIYAPEEINLLPGESKIVPIGIKVAIPHGYALLIQPRSGLSARSKLRISNTPGLIDEDYHEEIGVILENISPKVLDVDFFDEENNIVKEFGRDITIGAGERFAQMRLVEVPRVKWRQVSSLGVQLEDHGAGYGSTGDK